MSTFLQLTQKLVAELGIGGANNGADTPTTVADQTGQLWNAANWIREAHNNICLLHLDWEFLWTEYSETLTIDSTDVPPHGTSDQTPKTWDRSSFWINRSLSSAGQLEFMDWQGFRNSVLPGISTRTSGKPSTITKKPDGALLINQPADQAYAITAEFWRANKVLTNDEDEPDIPATHERIIICEAAIKYGNKEAAIEIIQGMEAEYIMLLDKLESDYLPLREYDRLGAADVDLIVDIPGYADDLRTR